MSFLGLELPMSDDEFKMAVAAVCLLVALVLQGIVSRRSSKPAQINIDIRKEEAKVADIYSVAQIEELPMCKEKGKVAFCRCWRTKKWPYCDGSHTGHNKATGDNIGPVVVTLK